MAPFTPFLSEELYRNLTGGESVHLLDWPNKQKINHNVIESMDFVLSVVNEGLSQRAKQSLKVRQPLNSVEIGGASEDLLNNSHEYEWMILEELNIKTIKWNKNAEFSVLIDTKVTPELKIEGIARDLVRAVQNARKNNGLNVEDRIVLRISTENELIEKAVNNFKDIIETETLASYTDDSFDDENVVEEKIDGSKVKISLRKA